MSPATPPAGVKAGAKPPHTKAAAKAKGKKVARQLTAKKTFLQRQHAKITEEPDKLAAKG